jgi:hypothetical protein
MECNKLFRPSVGADYAVSKKTTDGGIGPSTVTLSRSEGSVSLGVEMLRGVYTERSECAQHNSTVTHMASWINVFHCMIATIAVYGVS